MKSMRTLWAGGLALAGLLSAPAVHAATICVNPLVATCQATIQGGINLAVPGDKITIAKGVYFENVSVPPGKDGIQIYGAGKTNTILDPSPYAPGAVVHTGPGMVIFSHNVQVKNIGFRNGENFALIIALSGAVVQGNAFTGSGVDTSGTSAGVLLGLGAFNTQILNNDFHAVGIGVTSEAFGTLVKSNTFVNTVAAVVAPYPGDGVLAGGLKVLSNKMTNSLIGVQANADNAIIKGNLITGGEIGILLTEDNASGSGNATNPTIQSNRINGSLEGLIHSCFGCTGGSIAFNSLTDALIGIEVSTDGPGLFVNNNSVTRGLVPFAIDGPGNFLVSNKATDSGFGGAVPCVTVTGDFSSASKNTMSKCLGPGFYLNGNLDFADHNVSLSSAGNGLIVDGDDGGGGFFTLSSLVANKAQLNAAQGVAIINGADSTGVYFNSASLNRVDYCNDGTSTATVGNVFGTTADTGGTDCTVVH